MYNFYKWDGYETSTHVFICSDFKLNKSLGKGLSCFDLKLNGSIGKGLGTRSVTFFFFWNQHWN